MRPTIDRIAIVALFAIAGLAVGQPAPDAFTLPTTTLSAPTETQNEKQPNSEPPKAEPPAANNLDLKSVVRNGFVAETADKAFHFHFGGRFDYDNAWFTQDDNLLLGRSATTRLADGTAFRRVRLRSDGRVWENIDFALEVNFAAIQEVPNVNDGSVLVGSVGLTQANLAFRELPFGNLRIGFLKAPYSLERYTSGNVWYYMERSGIFDAFFGPNNRQSGVQFFDSYLDDRLTLNATVTRVSKTHLASFGFDAEDGLYAAGFRVSGLPIYEADGEVLMHLGFNCFHQGVTDRGGGVANRVPLRGGAGPDEVPNVLRTGTFFTQNGVSIVDGEWAFVFGPWSLSAEYAIAHTTHVYDTFDGVRYSGPRGNVTYHACYVEGGYFITPEDRRRYDKKHGIWDRTVPAENACLARDADGQWGHGAGAVQLVARLSYIDLVSGSPVLTPTSGGARAGTQRDVTLGVNWYLNPQTFFMVNYVWTRVHSIVPAASGDIHGIGVRMHFDF
jgi:phosphate-selective porin OprO/OprP